MQGLLSCTFLFMVAAAAAARDDGSSPLRIMTCVPNTLGSESFRAHQMWEYDVGKITQPAFPTLCLTVSSVFVEQQGAPGLEMLPCNATAAQNQTWELSDIGQLVLVRGVFGSVLLFSALFCNHGGLDEGWRIVSAVSSVALLVHSSATRTGAGLHHPSRNDPCIDVASPRWPLCTTRLTAPV
jgi:hypothetical protein